MVDSQLDISPPKSTTPTAGGDSFHSIERPFESVDSDKEVAPNFPVNTQESPEIHDSADLATPTIRSKTLGHSGDEDALAPRSMQGDATEGMPESSRSDHAKAGSPSHRRRSRPPLSNPQRPSGQFHSQSQPSLGHVLPSSSSSENVHSRHPAAFQGSSVHYSSATMPYSQTGGYVGQYTMSAQPSPMSMPHSPPPYGFSHTYHHPVVPDNNNMMSQNIHANYPTMLQPHAPVFPFQRHSPEGSSTSHASFSGTRSAPLYQPHQASPSPTSPHLPSSSGQSGGLTSSYVGSTPFPSLQYPSPLSTTSYPYPAQTYPPSPMYQSPFAPSPFAQHYTQSGETEPQGAWYYVPHPTATQSTQQYETGLSYQGHYTVGYPQVGRPGVDNPYSGAGPSSSSNPPDVSSPYPSTPTHALSARYSENRTPSDTPLIAGIGPPEPDPSARAPSSASSSGHPPNEKPVVRRSYHPNPPAHRSEWVMWAGNVPSDATHDELWRFFNQPNGSDTDTGVLSIFLISRSSCAFVNYETEAHLNAAIERFNGRPLRPNDPRCPRLVCRVRRKDDDLKAGVGGQRGMGMHIRWIREQKGKAREGASDTSDLSTSDDPAASPTSASERLAKAISNLSMSSDEGSRENPRRGLHAKHSSSSGSYTSTNSSFLAKNFPKRYFILKSLTQEDLDLSVEKGVWATQRHNEEILDQAYRTSKEVYLIFSVNKSGEFYGYARMAGPVRRGEQRIPWASRPPPLSPKSRLQEGTPVRTIFSPSDHRFVDSSPLPVDGTSPVANPGVGKVRHSAPAMLGEGYRLSTLTTPSAGLSLDLARTFQEMRGPSGAGDDDFQLDPSAPVRAARTTSGIEAIQKSGGGPPSSPGQDKSSARAGSSLRPVEEEEDEQGEGGEGVEPENFGGVQQPPDEERTKGEDAWGDTFAVQWICTDRVPFHRTKHLRNPWNHDREIKISRDGTELEPTVGQRLLDEWEKLAEPQPSTSAATGKPTGGKRASAARLPPSQPVDGDSEKPAREKLSRSR